MHHALKLLRSVEVLLLLEQENITGQRKAADSLAVGSAKG